MIDDLLDRAKGALSDREWAKVCKVEVSPDRAYRLLAETVAEIERLHTWDGLMSLLDEHWPETVFPTQADRESRDAGPRIVSMLRTVNLLRSELNDYRDQARDI